MVVFSIDIIDEKAKQNILSYSKHIIAIVNILAKSIMNIFNAYSLVINESI